jgi:hypothetical protein
MTANAAAVPNRADCRRRLWKAPRTGTDIAIPILRSGILARKFCADGADASVVAVFERSLYLRSADKFVCIGEPSIGDGPITLIADFGLSGLSAVGLRPGLPASISGRCITIGNAVRFSFDRCELWRPSGWPLPCSRPQLASIGDAILHLIAAEAPREGFADVYRLKERSITETPLARIARVRIARFESWLTGELDGRQISAGASSQGVADLIGLGPGLTPSGDDYLIGVLALLDALSETQAHAALARAIAAVPRGSTSPLSDYLLRTAAAGHLGEHLHRAIAAVISGAIEAAAASIRKIGHSSGWDMLAGVASALQAVVTARLR